MQRIHQDSNTISSWLGVRHLAIYVLKSSYQVNLIAHRRYGRKCCCKPTYRKFQTHRSGLRSRAIVEFFFFIFIDKPHHKKKIYSNKDVLDSIVPFFCPRMTPNTPWDWNFTTTPQTNLNGRALSYPRGHILGGSSSVSTWNPLMFLVLI